MDMEIKENVRRQNEFHEGQYCMSISRAYQVSSISNYLIDRVWKVEPSRNCVMAIAGETGSGKSYAGLTLCSQVDKDFSVDNVAFSLDEFRNQIKDGKKAILLDDLEVYASSREAMTKKNRAIVRIFQSVRFKRNLLLITTPSISYLDLVLRGLLHVEAFTAGINAKAKQTILKTFFRQEDLRTSKIYRHSPIIFDKEKGIWKKQSTWNIHKPSNSLINDYEKKKEAIFEEWLKDEPAKSKSKDRYNLPKKYKLASSLINKGLSLDEVGEVLSMTTRNVQKLITYSRGKDLISS